ncbi:MAG: hypothetical protein ISR65_06525 [Bacteriovoracaceae bacterium]|nr:hypothetical protein [Bacteriovoracaceae bacterium]
MKSITKLCSVFAVLVFIFLAMNVSGTDTLENEEKDFLYEGQITQNFVLENVLTQTRYRDEEIDDTCTREVPYTEEVCDYQTSYRSECRDIPGQQVCDDVPYQECTDVTRYRRECSEGPSTRECHREPDREVCHNEPDRRECSTGPSTRQCHREADRQECSRAPGRQVCRDKPAREVCETKPAQRVCEQINGRRVCRRIPGERVCRTVPGERVCTTEPGQRQCRTIPGERVCRDVPGQRECRTIPGERVCTTVVGQRVCNDVPGRRICQRVPYTDQECTTQTREECSWLPGREVCEDVPYQEYVCNDETRYKPETYACTRTIQVPYTVVVKKLRANVQFTFDNTLEDVVVDFKVILNRDGRVEVSAVDQSETAVIVLLEQTIDVVSRQNEDHINAKFAVSFVNKDRVLSPLSKEIEDVDFSSEQLKFAIGKVENHNHLRVKVSINKRGEELFSKLLTSDDFVQESSGDESQVIVSLKEANLGELKGAYDITIDLKAHLEGKVLNVDAGELKLSNSFRKKFHTDNTPNVEKVLILSNLSMDAILIFRKLGREATKEMIKIKASDLLYEAEITGFVQAVKLNTVNHSIILELIVTQDTTDAQLEEAIKHDWYDITII